MTNTGLTNKNNTSLKVVKFEVFKVCMNAFDLRCWKNGLYIGADIIRDKGRLK